jgi:galactose mutarotase-like enzyme
MVEFPVGQRLRLDRRLIPTGATERVGPLTGPVGDRIWDDAFEQIEPRSCFALSGAGRRIEVHYSDGFPVAQIFAPPGQEYVCVEPMTAPGNALAQADSRLEWVPQGQWRTATFRIVCRMESPTQE